MTMTEQDAIAISRYQASHEGTVERSIHEFDGAVANLKTALESKSGRKAIIASRERLLDVYWDLWNIVERSK